MEGIYFYFHLRHILVNEPQAAKLDLLTGCALYDFHTVSEKLCHLIGARNSVLLINNCE